MLIFDTSNTSAAVWIVFDLFDSCNSTRCKLVVHQAVVSFNTSTTVTNGNATSIVTTSVLLFALNQTF
ncbi:hypothetical protein D9M68_966980 [compost metagenome]